VLEVKLFGDKERRRGGVEKVELGYRILLFLSVSSVSPFATLPFDLKD